MCKISDTCNPCPLAYLWLPTQPVELQQRWQLGRVPSLPVSAGQHQQPKISWEPMVGWWWWGGGDE